MATNALPSARESALEVFHADTRRLSRRDWRLWSIAAFIMLMMFSTIAVMALEIEHRGMEFMSGVQLDVAVRGLFTMVLIFSLFVAHQQLMMDRIRRDLVQELRKGVAELDANWRAARGDQTGD